MNKIIVFSGTTEGKIISGALSENKVHHFVCVATEFGKAVMEENEYAHVFSKRLNEEEIKELFAREKIDFVIDATHPYALEVTKNIKAAATSLNIEYRRIVRESLGNGFVTVSGAKECAEMLKSTTGNILLTTGSKDLEVFAAIKELRNRLYVRIIPAKESLEKCEKCNIKASQIIAMVGPFSSEMNEAMIKQYDIRTIVTKDSGTNGGFLQKEEAAKKCNCDMFVIGRNEEEKGLSADEILAELNLCNKIDVNLIGIGMGNTETLTVGAKRCIDNSDLIIGASRMVKPYENIKRTKDIYISDEIANYLDKISPKDNVKTVSVLYSGDISFCSGATKLYDKLKDNHKYNLKMVGGISSVSYFASLLNVTYSDGNILSLHGKSDNERAFFDVADRIKNNESTFLLLSGMQDILRLHNILLSSGLHDCEITIGYNLSYEDQRIFKYDPNENEVINENGLYIAYIKNRKAFIKTYSYSVEDEEFVRDKVPMTKAEIRHICVQKLRLRDNATLYDVGAGTGSVSIEASKQSLSIKVYAIEKNDKAIKLLYQNCEKFSASNVEIISGHAPEIIDEINNTPTHAFIGGSNGKIKDIVAKLINLNEKIRIVATAISIESINELNEIYKEYEFLNPELISVNIAKGKRVMDYNLMEGFNPVYILSLGGIDA